MRACAVRRSRQPLRLRRQRQHPAFVAGRARSRRRERHSRQRAQPRRQVDRCVDHGHAVAAALLAGRDGNALPVRLLARRALALGPEHAALGQQGLDAGRAQFGGFFDQPVHPFVGGHAHGQMHLAPALRAPRSVRLDPHVDVAAAHALDHRLELAALAVEQRDAVARLQPQHLHVARGPGRQGQRSGRWPAAWRNESAACAAGSDPAEGIARDRLRALDLVQQPQQGRQLAIAARRRPDVGDETGRIGQVAAACRRAASAARRCPPPSGAAAGPSIPRRGRTRRSPGPPASRPSSASCQ